MTADPTIIGIQQATAREFDIPLIDLRSARQGMWTARARQVAMYLSTRLTAHSLPAIARHFGNCDHSTASHARRRITELRRQDVELDAMIEAIVDRLTPEDWNG